MSGLKYYVLDIETNGLDVNSHEISQISLIRCEDRHQLSKFVKVEKPWKSHPDALRITNRTEKDLLKGISKIEAIEKFNSFLEEDGANSDARVVIGHNVSFDRRFCYKMWEQFSKIFPAELWLDTKSLAGYYAKNCIGVSKPKLNLQAAMTIVGTKFKGEAHGALVDVQNTYILYDKLIKKGVDHLPFIKRIPQEE